MAEKKEGVEEVGCAKFSEMEKWRKISFPTYVLQNAEKGMRKSKENGKM